MKTLRSSVIAKKTKILQRQLTIVMIVQAAMPVICTAIPTVAFSVVKYCKWPPSDYGSLAMGFINWQPCLTPIFTICCIRAVKNEFFRLFHVAARRQLALKVISMKAYEDQRTDQGAHALASVQQRENIENSQNSADFYVAEPDILQIVPSAAWNSTNVAGKLGAKSDSNLLSVFRKTIEEQVLPLISHSYSQTSRTVVDISLVFRIVSATDHYMMIQECIYKNDNR
ncbi:unnamed protein product [Gongylonema pulchrum]|uniref:G_PROTEIN_RECEP_F1_2 domain-containing protein n=1 Tax=Gongylonema pulchrum TaxID=637853 RepID=A0A183D4Q8_9BILA|nr:unnamed protein product [Gongylonema pulchrum]